MFSTQIRGRRGGYRLHARWGLVKAHEHGAFTKARLRGLGARREQSGKHPDHRVDPDARELHNLVTSGRRE